MKFPATAGFFFILAGALWAGPSANDLLDQGSSAFGRQDYAGAIAVFSRLMKEFPEDSRSITAAFLRGVSQYQAGQPQLALDSFQKLERTWPLSEFRKRLPYWKGVSAMAAGLLPVAERELLAQAGFPEEKLWYVRSLFHLGLLRQQLKQDAAAVDLWKKFLAVSVETDLRARAELLLGRQAQIEGAMADALEWFRRASLEAPASKWDQEARKARIDLELTGSGSNTVLLIEESALLFPDERDFWETRRIEAFRKAGNNEASRQAILLRLVRETDPLVRQKLFLNLALLGDESGRPDLDLWAKAAKGPDATLVLMAVRRQASILEANGRWLEAAQLLDSQPEDEQTLSRAAEDYQAGGAAKPAQTILSRLIQGYPSSPSLPQWLDARAGLLLPAGDTSGALRDLDRILKDFPSYSRLTEVRYQMGLVYLKRDEPLRAESWFYGLVNELKSGELYERALLARGQAFVNAGNSGLARGSLERLIREKPNGDWAGDAWYALAKAQLKDRNFVAAWEAFASASVHLSDPARKATALWEGVEASAELGDPAKASGRYQQFASQFPADFRAGEALFRSGNVYAQSKDWNSALERWNQNFPSLRGAARDQTRQAMALAYLQLGQISRANEQLLALEKEAATTEVGANAWFLYGQGATALGLASEATAAFETLIRLHPASPLVEKALPRAAGALLGTGDTKLALARYADFFSRFGLQSSSVAVARSACAASAAYPDLLEQLVKESRNWPLTPQVRTEFDLAWWKSQLDIDPAQALGELQKLSREAPWSSQRSQALTIAGQWSLARNRTEDARTYFEAAQSLGDDLSVYFARMGLAQVLEKEGRPEESARQRETTEKSAGPGVPLEFRLNALKEALELWKAAGKSDDIARVSARLAALKP